jgi:hypothetical protein
MPRREFIRTRDNLTVSASDMRFFVGLAENSELGGAVVSELEPIASSWTAIILSSLNPACVRSTEFFRIENGNASVI